MKRFCTMYVFAGDEHIAKDVGQIPYKLAEKYGYESTLAGAFFSDQSKDGEHLKVDKIKRIKLSIGLTGAVYIIKNAKQIDILNLYHTNRRVWIHSKLYRFLNPKGKLYIKLDCGLETCDRIDADKQYRNYFIKCIELADFISVESQAAKNRLSNYDKKDRIKIIPNGFSSDGYETPENVSREKIILSVGNLSHAPKGTDDLIKAFHRSGCYKDGWSLVLAGRMDDAFKSFYYSYLQDFQELRNHIKHKGFITDRTEINKLYKSAEIFALPSYNESFSLAACEALANGCYLILSDRVTPSKELTNIERFGKIVPSGDIGALAEALRQAIESYDESMVGEIEKYAIKNFSWDSIIPKIQHELARM